MELGCPLEEKCIIAGAFSRLVH